MYWVIYLLFLLCIAFSLKYFHGQVIKELHQESHAKFSIGYHLV